jgi:hypothetical protein
MGLEIVCLAIVAAYAALRLRGREHGERTTFGGRFVALALASFAGEDTIIRAYRAYAYSSAWSVHLDRVPLVVVLVWPVVIDSARSLARVLARRGGRSPTSLRVATIASCVVLADASLIEPIAVRAGLWRWTDPGVFGVPLVGIAGWAIFAGIAVYVLEARLGSAAVVVLAPLGTHALVLASWFLLLRWTRGALPDVAAPLVAWVVSVALARAFRRGGGGGGEEGEMRRCLVARAPGAAFFFVLLGWTIAAPWPFAAPDAATFAAPPAGALAVVIHAAAFAPPYLVLLAQASGITTQLANRKSATKSV